MDLIKSFKPVYRPDSRVLILGTMPGTESLRRGQYYGHKRNQFWKIMFTLLGREPTEDYPEKEKMLLESRAALWDVFYSCRRKGSLDRDILNEVPNNIPELLHECPDLTHIFCNGVSAYKSLNRYYPEAAAEYVCTALPSTSPAYTIKFDEKLEKWRAVTDIIRAETRGY